MNCGRINVDLPPSSNKFTSVQSSLVIYSFGRWNCIRAIDRDDRDRRSFLIRSRSWGECGSYFPKEGTNFKNWACHLPLDQNASTLKVRRPTDFLKLVSPFVLFEKKSKKWSWIVVRFLNINSRILKKSFQPLSQVIYILVTFQHKNYIN